MSDQGFWSRRKAAVEAETRAEEAAVAAEAQAAEEAALAERTDEELLGELGLRDPDEMERPEEVRELLGSALPQRLKQRALRRLWRLNPVLANVDGLVDYGEDFTDAACVVENLQTTYQVGKGMLKSIEAYAEKAEALARAEAEGAEPVADGGPETAGAALASETVDEAESAPIPELEPPVLVHCEDRAEHPNEAESAQPVPRRMRFAFAETPA